MPLGAIGEVIFESPSLANGYLNDPGKSAASFFKRPRWTLNEDECYGSRRFYRSGDLAFYRHDGGISFVGRVDTQVKLHSQRIELAEVESQLHNATGRQHQCVAEVLRSDGGPISAVLVAYVALGPAEGPLREDSDPERKSYRDSLIARIKSCLSAEPPRFMVPTGFCFVNRIPLPNNGKVDRERLRQLSAESSIAKPARQVPGTRDVLAPQTDMERRLIRLWRDVLSLDSENIRVIDNLFSLGGNYSGNEVRSRREAREHLSRRQGCI